MAGARSRIRQEKRGLEGVKEAGEEEIRDKEDRLRGLKGKVEAQEKRYAQVNQQIVQMEIAIAEKERVLTVLADEME